MIKLLMIFSGLVLCFAGISQGRVGINTNSPMAMLHVKDSAIVFTGPSNLPAEPGNPPVEGAGTRMVWYPEKAAFRAGWTGETQWNKENIGKFSVAMGQSTGAKGESAMAFGQGSQAIGNNSTAVGRLTLANGFGSTSMGSFTNANGDFSTAMGRVTLANGFGSTSMGSITIANGSSSLVIGLNNDPLVPTENSANAATPLFIIGNGTETILGNITRSNAFVVRYDAKTGINMKTSTPQAGLHIKGIEPSFDSHLRLETAGDGTDYVNILYDGNTKFRNSAPGDEYQFRNSESVATHRLFDNGNMTIAGTLAENSDSSLKHQILPLEHSLDKLLELNGYQYYWKPELNKDTTRQIGLLAQNIEKVLPQLVYTDEAGLKSVAYQHMIPLLLEAIKELARKNEELEMEMIRISALQADKTQNQ